MRFIPPDRPQLATVETAEGRRNPLVLLEIRRGTARRRLRPVRGPVFLIGASAECDLVLADRQFPETHAYLLVSEEGVSLRHLGVGPEITVNGRSVEAAELLDGDRLRTGPYEFRLHVVVAPDGPGVSDAAQARRESVTARRNSNEAPLALVRALVADVRAALGRSANLAPPPIPSASGRNAA
jgi:hypothetical protein